VTTGSQEKAKKSNVSFSHALEKIQEKVTLKIQKKLK